MDPTSFRLFSGAAGATESEYFSFTHPTTNRAASAVDSSGNIYVVYYDFTANVDVVKYDKQGTVLWARRLNCSSGDLSLLSCVLDSSGNLYLGGYIFTNVSFRQYILLVKINNSGTLQWARQLGNASGDELFSSDRNAIDLDSSGNVHLVGSMVSSTNQYKCFYAKWNSSGALQAQESFGLQQALGIFYGATSIDASGTYPVIGGANPDGSGDIRPYVIAFGSGSTASAVTLDVSGGLTFTTRVDDLKVNNGIHISIFASTNRPFYVIKLPANLSSITWARQLGTLGGIVPSIDTNSSGDVYALGSLDEGNAEGREDVLVAKWNSSGTIQWSRYLGRKNVDQDETGQKIILDSANNNMWLFNAAELNGNVGTVASIPSLYFPDDGSLTGDLNHNGLTYKYFATNLSETSASFTATTATASRTTESFTEASASSITSSTISASGLTVVSQP